MRDENPPSSPPPTEAGGYPPPPPPAHREPDWKRQATKRERIAALVVLPALLVVIIAAVVASAATSDDPTADSPPTTATESPTTTAEATTTQSGTLTGLLVTPPPGVDQARADAFAAAVADALVAAGWPPLVQIDAEFLQASLTLMAIQCELLDTIAAIDPTDAEAVADRILAAIPEAVAALEANGVTPDQAAVLEAMPGWYAAMFTAAADYLCPQHAEALDNAVANAARAQP